MPGHIGHIRGEVAVLGLNIVLRAALVAEPPGQSEVTSPGGLVKRQVPLPSRLPPLNSPLYISPEALRVVPLPSCFPFFHSPFLATPSGLMKTPSPCYFPFFHMPL